jgi:hypothetical protein
MSDGPGSYSPDGDGARRAGVSPLTSALLRDAGFVHAFFTREGGVSPLPYGPLNAAATASVPDAPDHVRENLARMAAALGVPPSRVYFLSQVHGREVLVLSGDEAPAEVVRHEGDVTASDARGVACGVRTADCVPVLIADRRSGAVAAVHAGWRGVANHAVLAGIDAIRGLADHQPDLVAAIGPHIERCCFEVGADVARALAEATPAGERAVTWHDRAASIGAAHVDLRLALRATLEAAGLAHDAIDDVRGCTACDAQRFHSFRRDGKESGRMLSAIVARPRG